MLFFFLLHITCIYFAAVQLLNLQYYCIFVVQYAMLIIVYIELLLSKYFSIIAYFVSQYAVLIVVVKRPARDACLCMGELQAPPAPPAPAAPPAPPAPHFVFLITL